MGDGGEGWRDGQSAAAACCLWRKGDLAEEEEKEEEEATVIVLKKTVWTRGMSVDGLAGEQTADSEGTRGSLLV